MMKICWDVGLIEILVGMLGLLTPIGTPHDDADDDDNDDDIWWWQLTI